MPKNTLTHAHTHTLSIADKITESIKPGNRVRRVGSVSSAFGNVIRFGACLVAKVLVAKNRTLEPIGQRPLPDTPKKYDKRKLKHVIVNKMLLQFPPNIRLIFQRASNIILLETNYFHQGVVIVRVCVIWFSTEPHIFRRNYLIIQGFESYKGIVQSLRGMLQVGRGMLQVGSGIRGNRAEWL